MTPAISAALCPARPVKRKRTYTPEQVAARLAWYRRRYREDPEFRERGKARAKQWAIDNAEILYPRIAAYQKANRERCRVIRRAYRRRNSKWLRQQVVLNIAGHEVRGIVVRCTGHNADVRLPLGTVLEGIPLKELKRAEAK